MPDIEGPYIVTPVNPECFGEYPVLHDDVKARGCPTCLVYRNCYWSAIATAKVYREKRDA